MALRNSKPKRNCIRTSRVENLERRELMASDVTPLMIQQAPIEVSAQEQLIVELVNRARANPQAEALRLGIELNQGLPTGSISISPKQPLAIEEILDEIASSHSREMLDYNFFDHRGQNGSTPYERAKAAGYSAGAAENIAVQSFFGNQLDKAVSDSHDMLFRSPGHRQNLMNDFMRDIGVGVETGNYTFTSGTYKVAMTTQNFGRQNTDMRSITGVVYTDSIIVDDFYSIGEGMSNIRISAENLSTGEVFTTRTSSSGGYSLLVPQGEYAVHAIDLNSHQVAVLGTVTIGHLNVKVDVTADHFSIADNSLDLPINVARPISNDNSKFDINVDGSVTALDVLWVINHVNGSYNDNAPALDIDGDSRVTPLDVLMLINFINDRQMVQGAARQRAVPVVEENNVTTTGVLIDAEDPILNKLVNEVISSIEKWCDGSLKVELISAKQVDWRDVGLELDEFASGLAITPGYQIVVRCGTTVFEYRASKNGKLRYAGYANASTYLKNGQSSCCPWAIDAECLVALDDAIEDITLNYRNSHR